jgi:DNA processing protein
VAAPEIAERELARHEALGARLILIGEAGYPEALAAIADPPSSISVLGDAGLLARTAVAMVGARNASGAGQRLAEMLARDLGEHGLVITSGLARGIDAAAHRGALATGTVAVLGGGVDVVYPPEHRALYEAIAAEGVVVAEQPIGTEPQARHFPRRNRVIAGLCAGVLVIEAAPRSGSLITARMALDENRQLFAVPGSPLDPRCRGPNDLIRTGATLTESATDVIEALRPQLAPPPVQAVRRGPRAAPAPPPPPPPVVAAEDEDATRAAVVEALGPTPVAVDEVVRRCQLSAATVALILLDLELACRLERHPGHRVSLS